MGWYRTASGAVVSEAAQAYLARLAAAGWVFVDPAEWPDSVRRRVGAFYRESVGRPPSEADLQALLAESG